ncbi:hypothetical protein, partial [Salmonella enterica]|uniref:hypothetical protein n=1 Tax=Salmonella enterica TaxID=28901 RepID=UPI001C98FB18
SDLVAPVIPTINLISYLKYRSYTNILIKIRPHGLCDKIAPDACARLAKAFVIKKPCISRYDRKS